jgi:hypothetical protein
MSVGVVVRLAGDNRRYKGGPAKTEREPSESTACLRKRAFQFQRIESPKLIRPAYIPSSAASAALAVLCSITTAGQALRNLGKQPHNILALTPRCCPCCGSGSRSISYQSRFRHSCASTWAIRMTTVDSPSAHRIRSRRNWRHWRNISTFH